MGKNNLTIDDLIRFAYLSDVAYKENITMDKTLDEIDADLLNNIMNNKLPSQLKDIKIVNNDLAILNDTEKGHMHF
ncbi:hypothetical protein [Persephonella sp.]